ncbi:MAG TPA: SIMPL domain-containing protein [Thermoanaerobaculia bacterium]|nr:SIMPL domain-containing protein [Thermoanaerobaculia bacterium]
MRTFLLMTFALGFSVAAMAQSGIAVREPMPAYPETVTVSGTGRASVTPDRSSFSVGVQTVADSVDAAVNENNSKVAAVIAALKKAGAAEKDIRTSNFSIYPQQDYGQGKLPRILGYQVSNNITVRRENVSEAGRLLQTAVNAGVNTSSGLQFEVSDPARGRDQAMRAAYDEARAKAALLAQAAGRALGRAISINEGGQAAPPTPYPRAMAMRAEAVSEVPVEAGTQETSYTVSVVFELR